MAVINPTSKIIGAGVTKYTWAAMQNGDTGRPVAMPASADRTVQVGGTFGTGGNARIEGRNDETNFLVLTDADAAAINLLAAGIVMIRENPEEIRPNITAGDGTTSLNVDIVSKRVT